MNNKDTRDIYESLENIQSLDTVEKKELRLKYLKKEILKLEISVVAIGLIILGLILLSYFNSLSWFLTSIFSFIGVRLIIKAFRDGEILEIEKFFLLIFLGKDKEQKNT
jgi:hypothetical protein